MSLSVDDVELFEDTLDDFGIIRTIIKTGNEEESFYIVDIADVVQKYKDWIAKIPQVTPYYAIKCNPDPTVIKTLASLNAGFDCASEQEIKDLLVYGIPVNRIIFSNPTKLPSHIKFARKVNVDRLAVDGEAELVKIKEMFPEAKGIPPLVALLDSYGIYLYDSYRDNTVLRESLLKYEREHVRLVVGEPFGCDEEKGKTIEKRPIAGEIVIRIQCDAENSEVCLGIKFGCNPDDEAIRLIHLTKNLGLTLHGFSFHVGSPCGEVDAYGRGIAACKRLIAVAKSIGVHIKLIDIGGGFPGESGSQLDSFATVINEAIKDLDPGIEIISEPGRYFVSSSFTLASYLHSKKLTFCKEKEIRMYYVNCGVYTSFIEELLKLKARFPIPLEKPANDETFLSSLWGPTADSLDCILRDVMLPEVEIGNWLIWRDMGAYSIALCSRFNGFEPPKVYPFVRKSEWNDIDAYIKSIQNSGKVD